MVKKLLEIHVNLISFSQNPAIPFVNRHTIPFVMKTEEKNKSNSARLCNNRRRSTLVFKILHYFFYLFRIHDKRYYLHCRSAFFTDKGINSIDFIMLLSSLNLGIYFYQILFYIHCRNNHCGSQ